MRTTKVQISLCIHAVWSTPLDSIIPLLARAEISRPYLVSVAEQASLSLNWSLTTKTGFLVMWLISIWGGLGSLNTHRASRSDCSKPLLGAHHFVTFAVLRLDNQYSIVPFPTQSPFERKAVLESLHITARTIHCTCMWQISRLMAKPTKWSLRPAKTQISLGIRPVWSESLLCAQWVAEDPMFLHADSEDSDQTGWMPRLIWVFAGLKGNFVGFVMRQLRCKALAYQPTAINKHFYGYKSMLQAYPWRQKPLQFLPKLRCFNFLQNITQVVHWGSLWFHKTVL